MKFRKLFLSITLSAVLSGTSLGFAATTSPTKTNSQFTPTQVKQIETVIHNYLLENPQLVVQVLQKLEQQQHEKMQQEALDAIHANAKNLFDSSQSPVAGNKNGTVVLVEFFDYQCPHCKEMAKIVEKLAEKDKNLKLVFKEFPIFPGSMYAAKAALAGAMQGKYYEFHNALMADKNPLTKREVIETAKKIGLNISKLKHDMKSKAIKDELEQNLILAEKIGLQGTPAFIVQSTKNKEKTFFIPGQINQTVLQKLINKAN